MKKLLSRLGKAAVQTLDEVNRIDDRIDAEKEKIHLEHHHDFQYGDKKSYYDLILDYQMMLGGGMKLERKDGRHIKVPQHKYSEEAYPSDEYRHRLPEIGLDSDLGLMEGELRKGVEEKEYVDEGVRKQFEKQLKLVTVPESRILRLFNWLRRYRHPVDDFKGLRAENVLYASALENLVEKEVLLDMNEEEVTRHVEEVRIITELCTALFVGVYNILPDLGELNSMLEEKDRRWVGEDFIRGVDVNVILDALRRVHEAEDGRPTVTANYWAKIKENKAELAI